MFSLQFLHFVFPWLKVLILKRLLMTCLKKWLSKQKNCPSFFTKKTMKNPLKACPCPFIQIVSGLISFIKVLCNYEKLKKKPPSKVAQKYSFFSLPPWAATTEEFMFQNLAYRTTVYKTGVCSFTSVILLKVTYFWKQIFLLSFAPKNEQNFFLISALRI